MLFAALAHADSVHVAVIPAAAYDADDGFGGGARLVIDQYAPGYDPYKIEWVVHIYASVNGFHHHRLKFDMTGLGPNKDLRLFGHFAYRQWANDGYWGLGNGTTVAEDAWDAGPDDPLRKRYRYSLIQPFGRLTLRWDAGPTWGAFAYVVGRWTKVDTYAGSLLAEEQPFGMDGGPSGQIGVGVLHDTREPEITPDRGALLELAARYQPPISAGTGHFGGVFASARGFLPFGPKVVLGSRVMVDWLYGDIPFYDMITWGGLTPTLGFGGSETIRGNSFGRWRAPGKAVWNTELRWDVFRHRVFKRDLRWQLVPYLDSGVVFGAETPVAPGGLPVHPSLGLGVHPIFDESVAGRVDFAVAMESVASTAGRVVQEPSYGLYITFDHMF